MLGGVLVQRNAVPKSRLARMWGARQEALSRVVVAIHPRMRDAAEDREMLPVLRKQIQVGAGCFARLWKEKLGHHAQRYVDRQKTLKRRLFCRTAEAGECQTGACSAKEVSA
jgi:hypothetical protein